MFAKTIQQDLDNINRVNEGRHHDPFSILGCHILDDHYHIRVLLPNAISAHVQATSQILERIPGTDVFAAQGSTDILPQNYKIIVNCATFLCKLFA